MRLSVALLLTALLGVVIGAYLIGPWCVGLAIIGDSIVIGAYALLRDDGSDRAEPIISGVTEEQRFIHSVVDKVRSAS